MSDSSNDYRELASEINELRQDLARSAQAAKFMASANRATAEELKHQIADLESRLRELEASAPTWVLRLSQLEDKDKEHTGKIRTMELVEAKGVHHAVVEKLQADKIKNKLAFYGILASAVLPGLVALALQLLGVGK